MTVPTSTRKSGPYAGNGVTKTFAFDYKVFSKVDLRVVYLDSTNTESDLVLDTDYSVTLNPDQEVDPGGSITTLASAAIASGTSLVIVGNIAFTQPLDITNQGGFFPQVVENEFDRATMLIQQVKEVADVSFHLPASAPTGIDTELPIPESNKIVAWNEAATALQNIDPSTLASIVAFATARADTFTGDGATSAFSLTSNPGAINNLDVSINGLMQIPGVDFTWVGGTTLSMVEVPASDKKILAKYKQALPQGYTDSVNVNFTPAGAGAVATTVQTVLRRQPYSPEQFGAAETYSSGVDDTAFVNKCYTEATADGRDTVLNRKYNVSNVLFGNQATGAQSSAPYSIIGKGWQTGFVVKAGTAGTLLKSWSCAGVIFRDFQIDVSGTAVQGWDAEWKPGTGPSTSNTIENVRVLGGTAATIVNLKNLNDTFPNKLIVTASAHTSCCIDFSQSGGLASMANCIWNGGFLRFGSQNGVISNSWGHGIQFASGCVNYVALEATYVYWNTNALAALWSQSYSAFQSVGSLTLSGGSQLIGPSANSAGGIIDLNAASKIHCLGTFFDSVGTVNMFGPNCRKDIFDNIGVLFQGGSYKGSTISMNVATVAGIFDVSFENFVNTATAYFYPNEDKCTYYATGNTGAQTSGTYYDLIPIDKLVQGTYLITIQWTHGGGGQPYIFVATAIVPYVPSSFAAASSSAKTMTVDTYYADDNPTVTLKFVGDGTGKKKIQWAFTNGAYDAGLPSAGSYIVTARKLA